MSAPSIGTLADTAAELAAHPVETADDLAAIDTLAAHLADLARADLARAARAAVRNLANLATLRAADLADDLADHLANLAATRLENRR